MSYTKKRKAPRRPGLNSFDGVVGYLCSLMFNDLGFRYLLDTIYKGHCAFTVYERDPVSNEVTSGHWTFTDKEHYRVYDSVEMDHQSYYHDAQNLDVFCPMYALYYQISQWFVLQQLSPNFGHNLQCFSNLLSILIKEQPFLDACEKYFVPDSDASIKNIVQDLKICIYWLGPGRPAIHNRIPPGMTHYANDELVVEGDRPTPAGYTEEGARRANRERRSRRNRAAFARQRHHAADERLAREFFPDPPDPYDAEPVRRPPVRNYSAASHMPQQPVDPMPDYRNDVRGETFSENQARLARRRPREDDVEEEHGVRRSRYSVD